MGGEEGWLMANGNGKRRGRPPLRDLWAAAIWDALWKVHPEGLSPKELRERAGLTHGQVLGGARYLRETFEDEQDEPVVYVRSPNLWYIAPTWEKHTRDAIRSEYLQQSAARLHSAELLLTKSERAFPAHVRRIRKVLRNTTYLREEVEDLIADLH
jgi:hypothetical protein